MNDIVRVGSGSLIPAARQTSEVPLATAAWGSVRGTARGVLAGHTLLGFVSSGAVSMDDNRHILVIGGNRGGKGATFLIPNLLIYPGSVVVIDPKGENAIVTARRRGNGSAYCVGMEQRVVLLDPFDAVQTPDDHFDDVRGGFNPLDLVDSENPKSLDDATRIADALIVSESAQDPFWEESARALIKAVILHVTSSQDIPPDKKSLVTVREMLVAGDAQRQKIAALTGGKRKSKASGLSLLFAAMKRNPAFNGVIAQAGEMFGNLEENSSRTMASIAQIACTNTEFIDSPGMQQCLSFSSFNLSDLKTDPKGLSLYLCLPQAFMGTHYRWLRMITTLKIAEMERYRAHPASGYPILMMLDEFPALRRMRVIENAAAQIAGFGVRMVFAAQTLAQLKDIYKDNWETLVANAGIKMFFANDDHFTREYVSKLVGECEIVRTVRTMTETNGTTYSSADGRTSGSSMTQSQGGRMPGGSSGSSSSSTSTSTHGRSSSTTITYAETLHKRPLLTPDEVGRLFGDRDNPEALVLASGHQPLRIGRSAYYQLSDMAGLYDWHPDHVRPITLLERKQQADRRRQEAEDRAREEARHKLLLKERDARQLEEHRQQILLQAKIRKEQAAAKAHQARLEAVRREMQRIKEDEARRLGRKRRLINRTIFGVLMVLAFCGGAIHAWVRTEDRTTVHAPLRSIFENYVDPLLFKFGLQPGDKSKVIVGRR